MEKWAQSVNKKKDAITKKPTPTSTNSSPAMGRTSENFTSLAVRSATNDSEQTNKHIEYSSVLSSESMKKVISSYNRLLD